MEATQQETHRRRSEPALRAMENVETTAEVIAGGSMAEGIAGIAAVVLGIIGLAGVLRMPLLAVGTIAAGAALLFEGAAVSARYRDLLAHVSSGHNALEVGGGMSAESIGGAAGIALGVLALVGVASGVLVSTAAIVFGAAILLGTGVTSRLNSIEVESSGEHPTARAVAHEAMSAASGVQVLVGLGAAALGILALLGIAPLTLTLTAVLIVGFALMLSGSAVSARMFGIFHH